MFVLKQSFFFVLYFLLKIYAVCEFIRKLGSLWVNEWMNELCNNFIKLASVYPMAPNSQNWLRNKFLNQKKIESLNITKFTQTHRKTRLLATSFFFSDNEYFVMLYLFVWLWSITQRNKQKGKYIKKCLKWKWNVFLLRKIKYFQII